MISYAINLLRTGTTTRGMNPDSAPLTDALDARKSYHFRAGSRRSRSALVVEQGPPEGFDPPDLDMEPQLVAPAGPDIDPQTFADAAKKRLGRNVST